LWGCQSYINSSWSSKGMLTPGFTNLPCQAAQGVSFRKNLCKDIPRQSGPLALELRACEWLHTKAQQGITMHKMHNMCAPVRYHNTQHNNTVRLRSYCSRRAAPLQRWTDIQTRIRTYIEVVHRSARHSSLQDLQACRLSTA